MNLTKFKPQIVSTGDTSIFLFNNEIAVIEPKIDGIRIILEKKGKEIKLYSRLMRDWTKHFKLILKKLAKGIKYENCVLDGELAVIKDKKFTSSNIVLKNKLSKGEKYVYFVFDVLEVGNENIKNYDIITRKNYLQFGITPNENLSLVPYTIIDNEEDLGLIYKKVVEKGGEGVVLKNFQPYNAGKFNWLKKKPFETLDLEIISKKEKKDGKGWIYGLSDNQLQLKVANTCSVEDFNIGEIVEVRYEKKYEKVKGYSLRFPKIVRLREDKEGFFNKKLNRKEI